MLSFHPQIRRTSLAAALAVGVALSSVGEAQSFQAQPRTSSKEPVEDNRIGKIVYANPSTLPDGTKLPPVPVCTASHLGNGQWITAEHCLRDFSSFHGYIEQSDGERAQVTKTEAIGKETDIALLQTGPGIEADSFTLASEPARPGDTLFLLGFADNHPYSSLAVVKVQQLLSKVKIDRYSY